MDATTFAILATIAAPIVALVAILLDRRHRASVETRQDRREAKADGAAEGATNTELRHLIDLIGEVRTDVKLVPALVRDVDWLKESIAEQTRRLTSHIHSDHREIRADLKDIRDSISDEE